MVVPSVKCPATSRSRRMRPLDTALVECSAGAGVRWWLLVVGSYGRGISCPGPIRASLSMHGSGGTSGDPRGALRCPSDVAGARRFGASKMIAVKSRGNGHALKKPNVHADFSRSHPRREVPGKHPARRLPPALAALVGRVWTAD